MAGMRCLARGGRFLREQATGGRDGTTPGKRAIISWLILARCMKKIGCDKVSYSNVHGPIVLSAIGEGHTVQPRDGP